MARRRIAVVGRGLIGSAAAKYLARAGADVTLIGPDEPKNWAHHTGVFASHYDEGRITRSLDASPFWSKVSRASIFRYGDIEQTSGTRFFQEKGSVIACAQDSEMATRVRRVGEAAGIEAEWLDAQGLRALYPYLVIREQDLAAFEGKGAGHISPRKLVRAQGICAEKAGARILAETVSGIDGTALQTESQTLDFDHVLVATGAFCRDLLGNAVSDVTPYARTAAFFQLSEAEAARLADMPTLIHKTDIDDTYILPPIRYPDGSCYIKLGGDPEDVPVCDPQELRDWYRGGGSAQTGAFLTEVLLRRISDLKFETHHVVACSTTFTPEDLPRIGPVSEGMTMAVAGCGRGAKCSDELGRLAAEAVMTGKQANLAA